ncbi:leucyl/phenylalanyl-tRNA--protein transferase [Alteraurantiacibacter aestuarii]|uniref:Leucyl/phenylalanyl-tRNA--protein transferase n=1 Tax=Alteraurantiacibacter aestuarii TaxID=650004 RepID=A0A844ZJX9_9SPHN|nr:leucyl/phenylalanyl-tRNA--protein transferase [Alteraurantiacibacter aestuarii]MXO87340.1 leucyl/phenylalanyl-tRNA--protein transferase [Alteraurantiacibacter aestuarii]
MHAPIPFVLPAELLLLAYRSGVFPMSDGREDHELFWVEPRERAVIPLDHFRLSRSLAKVLRQDRFTVTCNQDFPAVIRACAQPRPDHPDTWISQRIEASYIQLHETGHAHSLECWQDGALVGGLYGVSFDRVFCGESMFSNATDASKVAMAWLVALMRLAGYRLLDCQFLTGHLASLGARTVTRDEYLELLTDACADHFPADLPAAHRALLELARSGQERSGQEGVSSSPGKLIAQSLTQTS